MPSQSEITFKIEVGTGTSDMPFPRLSVLVMSLTLLHCRFDIGIMIYLNMFECMKLVA